MLKEIEALNSGAALASSLGDVKIGDTNIDTISVLIDLGSTADWNESHLSLANLFAKNIDISGRLLRSYNERLVGIKRTGIVNEQAAKELTTIIIYRLLIFDLKNGSHFPDLLKRYNCLFKSLALATPDWLQSNTTAREELEGEFSQILMKLPNRNLYPSVGTNEPNVIGNGIECPRKKLRTLPITILFYEGPIARAYLETISSLGFRPQRIINLVSAQDVASRKPVGAWFPQSFRIRYAYGLQKQKIHFWPKKLRRTHEELVSDIFESVSKGFSFSKNVIKAANELKPLTDYCDQVEPLLIKDLTDNRLLAHLNENPSSSILYTGGGIVPKKILSIAGSRFLHVHPGFLPYIRGADCALWSFLVSGHFSATCFYMSPGIDTGDIITPRWLPKLNFVENPKTNDITTLYRLLYSFIDPWIRSYVLREVLINNQLFDSIPSTKQDEKEGCTFHFMALELKKVSLDRIFTG